MSDSNQRPKNPVKELRLAATPTKEEIEDRCPRDKTRQGLLQHELANRLKCSTSMVREMERDKKVPRNAAILANFENMWGEIFPQKEKAA